MEDIYKISLFRTYSYGEVQRSETKDRAWSFQKGVIVFPEARCPYCLAILRSPSIWMAKKGQLLGCWGLEKGKLVKKNVDHPHVFQGTGICMGNQKYGDEMAALFLGLSPNPQYQRRMKLWLKTEFDHDCSKSSKNELKPLNQGK